MKTKTFMKGDLMQLIDNPTKGVQKSYDIITASGEDIDVSISRIRDNAIISYSETTEDHLVINVEDDWSI